MNEIIKTTLSIIGLISIGKFICSFLRKEILIIEKHPRIEATLIKELLKLTYQFILAFFFLILSSIIIENVIAQIISELFHVTINISQKEGYFQFLYKALFIIGVIIVIIIAITYIKELSIQYFVSNNKHFSNFTLSKSPKMNSTKQVFILHDSKDTKYLKALEKQLAILERNNVIQSWNKGNIVAGSNVKESIAANLQSADIVLLLISADYLASETCHEIQTTAIRLGKYLIPVILRSCMWDLDDTISGLDARPKYQGELKPVNSWSNTDKAFEDVARGIYGAVKKLKGKTSSNSVISNFGKISSVQIETLRHRLKTKREILDDYKAELRQLEKSLSETEKYETRLRRKLQSNIEDVKKSIQQKEKEIQEIESQIA